MEDKKYIVTLAGDDFEELKALSDKFNGENQTQQEVFTSTFDSKNYEELKKVLKENSYAYILASSNFKDSSQNSNRKPLADILNRINDNDRFAKKNSDITDDLFFVKYFNTQEIESALIFYNSLYSGITSIEKLPEATHEGRESSILKIKVNNNKNIGVYITGGVHGNEWIPPEALIYFIKSLCDAFKNNKDLVIGKNTYPKETINKILERIEFYIYPLVNPDGRYQSQTRTNSDSMIGRKNRRPISKKYFGVDINRNFDFLWDYEKYFSRKAETYNLSKNISSDNYIGPYPFSEPETRNVTKLINDSSSNIKYYLDIHSKVTQDNLVLYSWGHSASQSDYSIMNFRNSYYWGQFGDRYFGEYVQKTDLDLRKKIARKMAFAASNACASRKQYIARTTNEMYLMSGSARDFMEGLSFVNDKYKKIHAFMIEVSDYEFNPPLSNRKNMVLEITASIIELCVQILDVKTN